MRRPSLALLVAAALLVASSAWAQPASFSDVPERFRLELSKSEARAINDAYVMRVSEVKDSRDRMFNVLRAYNGIVEEPFQVTLDSRGQFEFKLDNKTKTGTYTYVALQRLGEPNWVTVSGSIRVR